MPDQSQLTRTLPSYKGFYVVFTESQGELPWWQRQVLKYSCQRFGHVTVLEPITDAHMIVIEPALNYIGIEVREFDEGTTGALGRIASQAPVVYYEVDQRNTKLPAPFVPSCVTVAKAVLGISSPIVTPYQLYKYLLRKGGIQI